MTDDQDQLARLSPAQLAVLRRRMAARRATEAPRRDPAAPAPLSPAQRRLWFVQTLNPQSVAYNMHSAMRLSGPLDEAAMRAAFDALVARHEPLRAAYQTAQDGAPRQIPAEPPRLQLVDLSAAEDPDAALEAEMARLIDRPHALDKPPVRAALLRLGADVHVLAIGLHHIIADRWSLGMIAREMGALYAALRRGGAAPLPPVELQMADIAAERALPEEEMQAQLAWWRARLADAPALELPRDRRPGTAAAQAGVMPIALPDDLARAARAEARRRGLSLYHMLLTVCAMLCARYGDTDDVVLGSDVSQRDTPQSQLTLGPLLNTLALRVDLSGDPGFDAALDRVGASLRAGWARRDAPLDQIVEALNPARDADESVPVFRAKFDLQQADSLPAQIEGLRVARIERAMRAPKYELRFNLEDDGETLRGTVEYRADLYDAATIEQMAAHYLRLLRAALAAPRAPLGRLEMLSGQDRAALVDLAQGDPLPAHASSLHAAFEAQADAAADAPAIWWRGETLTYGDLEARANAVAGFLLARELAPEEVVGISMRRTPAMVAAILGVLKAGGAYAPLDPAYPAARLADMAQDAGIKLTLDDAQVAAILADHPTPPARPAPRGGPDGLAVIIFTSGSTGRPKGVELTHRNILARVAWASQTFDAADFAAMACATSISFDLSLFEIFATLANGGGLVLLDALQEISRLPAQAQVTFINTVPSLMRDLVSAAAPPDSLRAVTLAGEFFPGALLDMLQDFPQIRTIHNLYGPTEDAIYDAGDPVRFETERPMSIGRPLPGSRIHIVDRHGALAPRGAPGELWVGGAGLARGYASRPDLTAERFVADPFGAAPGARLYRSGDRGRWRADGRIDILGRIDGQVKIRGQRIETAEVESALESHPEVAEAAVLAIGEPGAPDAQLAAHLGGDGVAALQPERLREFLALRLPRYMIPQRWRVWTALPRQPNGKIDRKALAQAGVEAAAVAPVAPADERERRIIALWCELLGRDDIGAEDDFFARGGHSLLAMRLLMRLREEFSVDIALGQLFSALTPRRQAALLRAAQAPVEADDPTVGLSDAEVDALLAQMDGTTE